MAGQDKKRLIKDIWEAKHLSKEDKVSIINRILDKINEKKEK